MFYWSSISRESDEIRLSPSQQRERETIRYRPANNKKNHVRHHVKMRPLDMPIKARDLLAKLCLLNLTF